MDPTKLKTGEEWCSRCDAIFREGWRHNCNASALALAAGKRAFKPIEIDGILGECDVAFWNGAAERCGEFRFPLGRETMVVAVATGDTFATIALCARAIIASAEKRHAKRAPAVGDVWKFGHVRGYAEYKVCDVQPGAAHFKHCANGDSASAWLPLSDAWTFVRSGKPAPRAPAVGDVWRWTCSEGKGYDWTLSHREDGVWFATSHEHQRPQRLNFQQSHQGWTFVRSAEERPSETQAERDLRIRRDCEESLAPREWVERVSAKFRDIVLPQMPVLSVSLFPPLSPEQTTVALEFIERRRIWKSLAEGFASLWSAMQTDRGCRICSEQLTRETIALVPRGLDAIGWRAVVLADAERVCGRLEAWYALPPRKLAANLHKMIRGEVTEVGAKVTAKQRYEAALRQPKRVEGAWTWRKGARR